MQDWTRADDFPRTNFVNAVVYVDGGKRLAYFTNAKTGSGKDTPEWRDTKTNLIINNVTHYLEIPKDPK